jgi:ribosome-binding protein aMBF1 (putative translation factor)
MAGKKTRRIVNPKKLTRKQAAEYRRLRERAEEDKPEIMAEGRRLLAAKRQREAATIGASTLGQKIRQAREAHGWSQAELATRAKLTQAHLSYLEADEREPSLSIAARLAHELGIPLDELALAVR